MTAFKPLRIIRTNRDELHIQAERLGLRGKMNLQPVITTTQMILDRVRQEGDQALIELTEQFDHVRLKPEQLRISEREISQAVEQCDSKLMEAMRRSAKQIRGFHNAQLTDDIVWPAPFGGRVSLIKKPLDIVGVYVPGGTAPLPSSVLMNIIPARSAGVRRIVLCTPPQSDGQVHPAILAAASLAGADELYRVGGAQAIAAMAYGTESIPAVDKITGPGNIYVNTAKRLVFGQVDIDMFAGPSEILIIADQSANPAFVAADLLSQAEHDPLASALLLTDCESLAQAVAEEITIRVPLLPRASIIAKSLADYGAAFVVPDLKTAVDFANEIAPEHLELIVENPDDYLAAIHNAGAIFVGPYSPEPLGDYYSGANHVLPTSGTARFFSPLNTDDFIKKTSIIHYTREDLADCHQAIETFAEAEQLRAHAESVRVRFRTESPSEK
jgi:histidinol dehydrogenase